jgi:hypothetical protein
MSNLDESRARVERSFSTLSEALKSEVGVVPRGLSWALPVAAFAVGFAAALVILGRRAASK